MTRHLLEIDDLAPGELAEVLASARIDHGAPLEGAGVALVMGLSSARTRNSTEMAVVDLGGHPVAMTASEVGIDTRESAEDLARTLAQYHRAICVRHAEHHVLERMAAAMSEAPFGVPVVNLLSSEAHPVQALADLLTLSEAVGDGTTGSLRGTPVAWVGDANNVARSFALAAMGAGMAVRVAAPSGHEFSGADVARIRAYGEAAGLGGRLELVGDPSDAARGSTAICTDVWVSMGQEAAREERLAAFEGYQVTDALFEEASPGAVLLHCLPAHRGEEVDDAVLDGARSRVWAQAAHRRTATRGLLAWLVGSPR